MVSQLGKNLQFGIVVLFFVLVFVMIIFSTVFVSFFFPLFTSSSSEEFSVRYKGYQYMSLNRITNEMYFEIISYPEIENERGYMVVELEDSFELISELRSTEYICTGVCFCENENFRKSSTSSTVSRSLKYVVGSVSSIIAVNYARSYFEDICMNEFSQESDCSEYSIRTEIDDCEEVEDDPRQEPLPLGDGFDEPWQVPLPLGNGYEDPFDLADEERESAEEVGKENQEKSKKTEDCEEEVTVVHSDGCCYDNGKVTARAGVGVFFGPKDERNVARRLPGKQTNNRAELTAILDSINSVPDHCDVEVRSDSLYAMHVSSGKWKAKENIDLVRSIKELIKRRKGKVIFVKVKGHTGKKDGNYYADLLANEGAEKIMPK